MKTQIRLVKALMSVLANTYALYLKTQNYHWNVTGSNFSGLHALFEEQYSDLAEAIDALAERIRALGEKVPAKFSTFSKLSLLKEGDEKANSQKMLKDLHSDQLQLIKCLQQALDLAQSEGDPVTGDSLVDRIQVHEKNAWMLKSHLE